MPDPNVVDRLGVYVIVALLAGTALYAAWLLLMRLVVARQVHAGTMTPDAGAALLRRLNSTVLALAVGSAISTAPFSPFQNPNPHLATVATAAVDGFALLVYAYILIAVRRLSRSR
jgi:hypothetical protein